MVNPTQRIYNILHEKYDSQKWWPTTLTGDLHPTYHGKKHNETQQFEIIVGTILTQNTSWKNVEKAIFNLNNNKLLSIEKIKKTKQEKIAELIKPAGYFNQKSERLKILSEYLYKKTIKELFSQPINKLREELLSIKGIGPETADSIILYSANKATFVIDTYTKRIFSRIGLCKKEIKYEELQQQITTELPRTTKLFNEYHALLVELAKRHCKTKPECNECPLSTICKKKI